MSILGLPTNVDPYGLAYLRFADYNRIYDGDTIYFDIDEGDYRWEIGRGLRVFGIDTPENNPLKKYYVGREAERDNEKWAAKEATARAEALIKAATGKYLIQTIKRPGKKLRDKYGRTLGRIFIPLDGVWLNLAAQLLKENHARPYSGGRKTPWVSLRELQTEDPGPLEVARLLKETA